MVSGWKVAIEPRPKRRFKKKRYRAVFVCASSVYAGVFLYSNGKKSYFCAKTEVTSSPISQRFPFYFLVIAISSLSAMSPFPQCVNLGGEIANTATPWSQILDCRTNSLIPPSPKLASELQWPLYMSKDVVHNKRVEIFFWGSQKYTNSNYLFALFAKLYVFNTEDSLYFLLNT